MREHVLAILEVGLVAGEAVGGDDLRLVLDVARAAEEAYEVVDPVHDLHGQQLVREVERRSDGARGCVLAVNVSETARFGSS